MFIVSIDGGGARGAIPAAFLARIGATIPRADLYAGTSAGAIVAASSAAGLNPESFYREFVRLAPSLFRPTFAGGFVFPKYSSARLRGVLREFFGDRRLGELPRRLLVPAVRLDAPRGPRPKFFDNLPDNPDDADLRVADVVAFSCSAPVYFGSAGGFIDGGVAANNPVAAAVALALNPSRPLASRADEVFALSLGTGTTRRAVGKKTRAGLLQWAADLVPVIVDGGGDAATYIARAVLGARFLRVDFPLAVPVALDDVPGAIREAAAVRRDLSGVLDEQVARFAIAAGIAGAVPRG